MIDDDQVLLAEKAPLARARGNASPAAIVLCRKVTGLATVRALARAGISVQAWVFSHTDPTRHTRFAKVVILPESASGGTGLIDFLLASTAHAGPQRPVVFPTCDAHALLLAEHAPRLIDRFRISTTSHDDLLRIVSKDRLYRIADTLAVPTVPAIVEPTSKALVRWSAVHPGPYFIKPFYVGTPGAKLRTKNLVVPTRGALLDFVYRNRAQALIVQRFLQGGDGHVFDTYGLCDAQGRIVQMATHRRWRQHMPDCGATSFGEIPSGLPTEEETVLLEQTRVLLSGLRYHGIFGIEWLRDRETGTFYLIDFNARLFMSIGHLVDSGFNLPALAWRELTGALPPDLVPLPQLARSYWVDLLRDMQTFRKRFADGELGFGAWLVSVLRCRSWAYLDFRDPRPGIARAGTLIRILSRLAWTRLTSAFRRERVFPAVDYDVTR